MDVDESELEMKSVRSTTLGNIQSLIRSLDLKNKGIRSFDNKEIYYIGNRNFVN